MHDQYKTTRFGLIRHAQTVWNRDKKIQGHCDSPLTAEGEKQALCWGQQLAQFEWDAILSSDAGRAVATAEIINSILNVSLTIDSRLKEQDWGQWEGKTVRQIEAEAPQILDAQVNAGWNFCPPGGESRRSALIRSRQALQEAAERYTGQQLLVVLHEGIVKCLIYHLCNRKFVPDEPAILKSYQLHRLVYGSGGLEIKEINAVALGS